MRHRLTFACLAAGVVAFSLTTVPMAAPRPSTSPVPAGQGRGGGTGVIVGTIAPPPQPPKTGAGAISGLVTDAESKQPIAGALVQLGGDAGAEQRPRQVTDAQGRFMFGVLPASPDYAVSVTHPAYLFGRFAAVSGESDTVRIALNEGQSFTGANVSLHKPASITGMVIDERGDPVVGVPVRVLKSVRVAGRMQSAAGPVTETDDRGMYRVSDLSAGSYLVHVPSVQITLADGAVRAPVGPQSPMAMARAADGFGVVIGHFATAVPPASGRGYPMAYFPSARSVDEAQAITLDYGEARANIDVQLTLAPTVRVSGTLAGPASAIASMPVWLVPTGGEFSGPGGEAATTLSTPTGAFTFLNVPAGQYTLIASRSQSEYSTGGNAASVQVLPERGSMFNISMVGWSVAGADGVSYRTRARVGVGAAGRLPVAVTDRDVTGLVVTLSAGVSVSGHFLWDGQEEAPASARLTPFVILEPANGDLSLGFPQSEFAEPTGGALPTPTPFTILGVIPGRYFVAHLLLGGGITLEGAEWRGRDLLSSPLDVTVGDDITGVVVRLTAKHVTVAGTVRDASGAPVTSGAVVFFPAAPADWNTIGMSAPRFKTSAIISDGTYQSTQLLPGDYLVAAISNADRAKWLDAKFLASIAGRATKLHIDSGATITQDLRLPGGGR